MADTLGTRLTHPAWAAMRRRCGVGRAPPSGCADACCCTPARPRLRSHSRLPESVSRPPPVPRSPPARSPAPRPKPSRPASTTFRQGSTRRPAVTRRPSCSARPASSTRPPCDTRPATSRCAWAPTAVRGSSERKPAAPPTQELRLSHQADGSRRVHSVGALAADDMPEVGDEPVTLTIATLIDHLESLFPGPSAGPSWHVTEGAPSRLRATAPLLPWTPHLAGPSVGPPL